MQSLVRPIARRSFLATGGSGAVPTPLTIFVTSNPNVSILCSPVSRILAAICTPPATLAVGATTNVSWLGARRAFSATQPATSSVGAARVSSTSTPRAADSA